MTKRNKIIYCVVVLLSALAVGLGGYYLSRPTKIIIRRDEAELFFKLSNAFQMAQKMERETDLRIYSENFPHFQNGFAELEEKRAKNLSYSEWRSRLDELEASNPGYKAYNDAVSDHMTELLKWEALIKESQIHAAALNALVKTYSVPEETPFKGYAEAAESFWVLEHDYFWNEWCWRTKQLSKIDQCLRTEERGAYGNENDEGIDERRKSAMITLDILQERINEVVSSPGITFE